MWNAVQINKLPSVYLLHSVGGAWIPSDDVASTSCIYIISLSSFTKHALTFPSTTFSWLLPNHHHNICVRCKEWTNVVRNFDLFSDFDTVSSGRLLRTPRRIMFPPTSGYTAVSGFSRTLVSMYHRPQVYGFHRTALVCPKCTYGRNS